MPNHCTNKVYITGSVKNIKTLHNLVGDKFDFNKIIPMPEGLNKSMSPTKIVSQKEYDEFDVSTLREGCNRAITQEMADCFMKKCGYTNWYDWSIKNWGTKWEAYDVQDDWSDNFVSLEFFTAWSPPKSIYDKLVELFPDLNIDWKYMDEGDGFRGNFVTGVFQEGI